MLSRVLPVAASAVLLLSLSACGSDDSSSSANGSSSASTSASTSAGSGKACDYPTDAANAAKQVDPPPSTAAYSGKVKATITTSVGDLKLSLDADAAPCTVNSFVSLAKQGYYDDTSCHRLGDVPGFQMLQCGDPSGTGSGGPGYTVPDEYTGKESYSAGTLAMANTGQPNSGGSQFFMVFGDTQLDPTYTVFGTLDAASIKILEGVAKDGIASPGQDGTGAPKTPVTFSKVTID